jgi:hypothetical protein
MYVVFAWTEGIMVLKRARKETNAVVHDADNEGKRAIVEMEELVYEIEIEVGRGKALDTSTASLQLKLGKLEVF